MRITKLHRSSRIPAEPSKSCWARFDVSPALVSLAGRSGRISVRAPAARSTIAATNIVPIPVPRLAGSTDPSTWIVKCPSAPPRQDGVVADQLLAVEGADEILADYDLRVSHLLFQLGGPIVLTGAVDLLDPRQEVGHRVPVVP